MCWVKGRYNLRVGIGGCLCSGVIWIEDLSEDDNEQQVAGLYLTLLIMKNPERNPRVFLRVSDFLNSIYVTTQAKAFAEENTRKMVCVGCVRTPRTPFFEYFLLRRL